MEINAGSNFREDDATVEKRYFIHAKGTLLFANSFLKTNLHNFVQKLGIDYSDKDLFPKLEPKTIDPKNPFEFVILSGVPQINMNPATFLEMLKSKEVSLNPEYEEFFIAIAIFHEYGHHIQALIDRKKMSNKAWTEDTADYFSGFLLGRCFKKKNFDEKELNNLFVEFLKLEKPPRVDETIVTAFGNYKFQKDYDDFRYVGGHNMVDKRVEIFKSGFQNSKDFQKLSDFFNKFEE